MSKIIIMTAMLAFLASCVVVPGGPHVVPPGQVKKMVLPGKVKRF